MRDLLRRRDLDNQRSRMIVRLKEDRIVRLEVSPGLVTAEPTACNDCPAFLTC